MSILNNKISPLDSIAEQIRYSAFCELVFDVNRSTNFTELAALLTKKLKYIVDVMSGYLGFYFADNFISLICERNRCYFSQAEDSLSFYSKKIIKVGIPISLSENEITTLQKITCIFDSNKIVHISITPYKDKNISYCLILSSSQKPLNNDINHKFSRLIGELLAIKIKQLLLEKSLNEKSMALIDALEKSKYEVKMRKARELELQLSEEELQTSLHELRKAQAQLVEVEKMLSLGQLVAGVAHEINTPIGVCITAASYTQDLIDDLTKKVVTGRISKTFINELISNLKKSSVIVLNNLTQASNLIGNFKQVAVEQSKEICQSFNLLKNLQQIVMSLKRKINSKKCKINLECDPELTIKSYPDSFMQIYSNLILNSLIHGFEEPNDRHKIDIKISREKEFLIINYRDNGKGIDSKIIDHIFDPFVTTKRGSGSSGLGTHIVYNIVVQLLKGNIECDSSPDHGAHFTIILPFYL